MPERQWTGSCANVPASLRALASAIYERTNEVIDGAREQPPTDRAEADALLREAFTLIDWLRDHATTLNEWGDAVEQLYARLDEGSPTTNAQGIGIARLMRSRPGVGVTNITPSPFGLPGEYVGVAFNDGFVCGIAPDGSVSS